MKLLLIANNLAAIVDDDVIDDVGRFSWQLRKMKNGGESVCTTVDADTRSGRTTLVLARHVMGAARGTIVDHKNGNVLDNRRENLRLANPVQSSRNTRMKKCSSNPFRGVMHTPAGRWAAYIRIGGGGKKYLGTFDTAEMAAKAYDESARQMHGEFACLNFPREGERGAI